MNDRLRLALGLLACTSALRCTSLEAASDRFSAGATNDAGTGDFGSGAVGGAPPGAGQGGSSAGSAGTLATAGRGGAEGGTAGRGGTGAGGALAGGTAGESGAAGETGSSGDTGAAGSGEMDCEDETGFHGLGCYRCEPTDILTLERACTDAVCRLFDNGARLTLLPSDGHLPTLPPASSGGQGGTAGAGGAAAAGAFNGGTGSDAGASSAGAGAGVAGAGGAGFACADLGASGTIVYVTGSSASKPFLQQIAQQLSGDEVFLVYTSTGSCVGVDAIVNGTLMTTGAAPAPAATATYWDSSSSSGKPCDLPAGGVSADLGVSDVFAESCPGFELTNLDAQDIRDAHGPIQTMTFVVPTNSPHAEISAQAAYFVYGFGAANGVLDAGGAPMWQDESLILQRSGASGTQAMLASAIGVPAERWKGKQHKTSDDVSAALQSAAGNETSAASAIGILAADYIDTKNLRAQLKVLAFQDSREPCAFFPDSTATAHDKQNVRDGHYPVWGPLHLLYKADQAGRPLNPDNRQPVTDIIGYLSGTKALPNGVKLLDVYAQSGLVPECAMHVARTRDGGDIVPHRPSNPCSCLFEAKATGSTTCEPCTVQGDCESGESCSQGYCEK